MQRLCLSGTFVRRGVATGVLAVTFLPFAVASADGLKPPGDCTEKRHRQLQDVVDMHCQPAFPGEQLRCEDTDTCAILWNKQERFRKCYNARSTINTECFRGGDKGHRDAAISADNAMKRCYKIRTEKKCEDKGPDCR
jgi:Novel toxin 16